MTNVRWGILGCGDVTEIKSGPALRGAAGSEVVAVMRRDPALAADYARRHGVGRWYDDAAVLIADSEVDAVYIATPPGSHCEYALRVAEAGKPAYVEKPMARNEAECREMIAAFERVGRKLFVAYYRRALPRFLKVQELLDANAIGTVTGLRYRHEEPARPIDPDDLPWRLRAEESGGGLFFDLGSHALDLFDFLLGPVAEVSGAACNRASSYDVEDNVVLWFRTDEGVPAVASWNFAGSVAEERAEIVGTQGRITFSVFDEQPIRLMRGDDVDSFEIAHPSHIQQPLIQTVVDDLLGRGTCPSTGESAARTARVMDRVVESYYGARSTGFWSDPQRWPGRRR